MRGKRLASVVCLAGALTIGSLGMQASYAFASSSNGATNGTIHCDPSSPSCGFGPGMPFNPVIGGPPPPFVTVTNCPSFISAGDWVLNFVSGNAVVHGTSNNNGGWGGSTAEGQAVLSKVSDGTTQYVGHLQEWGGGGNNSGSQSMNGFTVNFNGSGPAGNISIHANTHVTTNNSGTTTSNVANGSATCS